MDQLIATLAFILVLAGPSLSQYWPPVKTENRRNSYLIVDDVVDADPIKNAFAEAVKFAKSSNDQLEIGIVSARVGDEIPRVKETARSAAISAAISAARLAIRSNANLAAGVKGKNLAQIAGDDVDHDGSMMRLVEEAKRVQAQNSDLAKAIDASNQLRMADESVDECSDAFRNAVSAARLAHLSNVELAHSASINDEVAARRNAGEPVNLASSAVSSYNAGKLIQRSKADLTKALQAKRCTRRTLELLD